MFPYNIRLSSYTMSRATDGSKALHQLLSYFRNGLAGVVKFTEIYTPGFSELCAAHLLYLSHRQPAQALYSGCI